MRLSVSNAAWTVLLASRVPSRFARSNEVSALSKLRALAQGHVAGQQRCKLEPIGTRRLL